MLNLWLFGITDSKGQVELFFYYIYSQMHSSFLSLLQKYISNVVDFTEVHLLSQLRPQVNMAEAVDIKMPRKRVDGLVNGQIWTTYSADLCLVVRDHSFLEFLLCSQFMW